MSHERSETQRALIQGSTLGVGVLMALAVYGMVNYLSYRHYQRADWTSSQLYTLSEKSLRVVRDLDQEIDMVVFLSPSSELYDAASELLDRYAAANPDKVHKREIDPAKNLLEAQRLVEKYSIERENVIVVATENDRRVIDEFDMAEYDYSGAQFGQGPTLQEFKGESQITSALLALAEAKKPKILFTTGHGEEPLSQAQDLRSLSQARDLLGKDNFEIEEWSSLGQTEVPTGTDLLVVAGPTTNFLPPELETFSRYLDAGGRMLLLIDPVFNQSADGLVDHGVGEWLAGYGVEIGDDIVVDPSSELPFFGPETIFTDAFGTHPIVEALEQTRTRVLLPLARSVGTADVLPDAPGGGELTVEDLVLSSAVGWGETNLAALETVAQDDDDVAGPVSLGVAVSFKVADAAGLDAEPEVSVPSEADDPEAEAEESEAIGEPADGETDARLVVLGDSDFATDAQLANGANSVLLLNVFNWLVKREKLIDIEGRRPEQTRLSLSQSELTNIYLIVLILMPALALIAGISVWRSRRR